MKCHLKGNSYKGRKPFCKKWRVKCVGESNCDYAKEQERNVKQK
tara:strand:- start:1205 stop:1336 length:132 start_codon:yes stop_codon:yes gene_type:complete